MKTKTAPAATPAAIQGDRMKTVVVKPEFAGLTEEQVIDAIDAYEAQVDEYYANKGDEEECGCGCSHDEGSCEDSDDDVIPSDDPIVLEVERLIAAYSDRFDELCKENGEGPHLQTPHAHRAGRLRHLHRCPARLPHGRRRRVKRRKGPQTRSLLFHKGAVSRAATAQSLFETATGSRKPVSAGGLRRSIRTSAA